MRSVERRNHALHGISSEPNQGREKEAEREKKKRDRGGEDPQLKFPNGLERNAPREYCDFFLSLLADLFPAHERIRSRSRDRVTISDVSYLKARDPLLSNGKKSR